VIKITKIKRKKLIKRLRISLRKEKRCSGYQKSKEYRRRIKANKKTESSLIVLKKLRSNFKGKFFKLLKYDEHRNNVSIDGQFGLEHDIDTFIQVASSFIDSHSKWVEFKINDCSRIWPSAITLLCSFKQWTEITAHQNYKPTLSSTSSKYEDVNSYLAHCGFYDYVRADHQDISTDIYDDKEIVKIKRENNKSEIEEREESICSILASYSTLTDDEVEEFDCIVLIEGLNNVAEHGKSFKDSGWWTITQYHPKTGIISLCLADNGVGIKNSLLTGPQRDDLRKHINVSDDGAYIEAALKENVSGALTGSMRKTTIPFMAGSFSRGSRRGNGLARILSTCKKCGIAFNILSQYGYLCIDRNGNIVKKGTAASRIFAGTLYHFTIPAKKLINEGAYEDD